MHQREAMRGGANGLQTIQLGGQQIGGTLESAHYGSSERRPRRPTSLVRRPPISMQGRSLAADAIREAAEATAES